MDKVRRRGEIISLEQRSLVSQRYKRITRTVNSEFWDSTSETAHSLYVGSYGRGTAIDTSDIDMLVELPKMSILNIMHQKVMANLDYYRH